MVTDKNERQFKSWYYNECLNEEIDYYSFGLLPFEMQIGVYLAYYDSLPLYIRVDYGIVRKGATSRKLAWNYKINADSEAYQFESRNEALKQAFKKSNDLINKI